jgi:hypothetical protein
MRFRPRTFRVQVRNVTATSACGSARSPNPMPHFARRKVNFLTHLGRTDAVWAAVSHSFLTRFVCAELIIRNAGNGSSHSRTDENDNLARHLLGCFWWGMWSIVRPTKKILNGLFSSESLVRNYNFRFYFPALLYNNVTCMRFPWFNNVSIATTMGEYILEFP